MLVVMIGMKAPIWIWKKGTPDKDRKEEKPKSGGDG